MKARLELDVSPTVAEAVSPSLQSSDRVQFDVEHGRDLEIGIEADGLGPLRGATNTALMLAKLSDRFTR